MYYPNNDPFITLKTNGIHNFKGNSFPNISILKCLNIFKHIDNILYKEEDRVKCNNFRMNPIIGDVKIINCKRLENLEKGLELEISSLISKICRNKIRYIFKFTNLDECYISNYWLEKEIKDNNIDRNYKINIKSDRLKVTPTKHKERLIFVATC